MICRWMKFFSFIAYVVFFAICVISNDTTLILKTGFTAIALLILSESLKKND